jgi:hypothetical protein
MAVNMGLLACPKPKTYASKRMETLKIFFIYIVLQLAKLLKFGQLSANGQ